MLKCNKIAKFMRCLCTSRAVVVKGEYVGVTLEIEEGVEGGSNLIWEWSGWKAGWENVDGLGSELSNSSGVSRSEILNWEIVLYTVAFKLVSEFMPDEVLSWGDSGGGKQKVVWWGGCLEGWLSRKLSDGVIQLGGSSWAKKMVDLRTKVSGMWLFYNLLVWVFFIRLLGYYVLTWDLWVIRSRRYEVCQG